MGDNTTRYIFELTGRSIGIKELNKEIKILDASSKKVGAEVGKVNKVFDRQVTQFTKNKIAHKKVITLWTDTNKKLQQTTRVMEKTSRGWKTVTSSIRVAEQSTKRLKKTTPIIGQFTTALKRVAIVVPMWALFRAVMQGLNKVLRTGLGHLKNWETQMAKIKIVGRATKEEFDNLSTGLLRLASAYGASTEQLGEGAVLWRQQGKAMEEVIPLMEATIKLSMLTGRTIKDSVEDLTVVMKNFGVSANDSTSIVDKLTKVMLNHAITTDVLAQALRTSAPMANQFGITFEKLLGLITATHVATRAKGTKIGKTWQTIFSRMATTAKTAIHSIARVPLFMDATGEATFRNTGILRNFGAVLDEIAVAYSGLAPYQQAQLSYAIAGRRRIGLFTSAMQNYAEGIQASVEALKSFGESGRATGIILDTIEAKQKRLVSTFKEGVSVMISGTASIKNALDTVRRALEQFTLGMADLKGFSFGKLYEESIVIAKAYKSVNFVLDRRIGILTEIQGLSKSLTELSEMRNRSEALGTDEGTRRVKEIETQMNIVKKALSETSQFEDIMSISMDNMISYLKKKSPEIAESLLTSQATKKIQAGNEKLANNTIETFNKMLANIKKLSPEISSFYNKEIGKLGDLQIQLKEGDLNEFGKRLTDWQKKLSENKNIYAGTVGEANKELNIIKEVLDNLESIKKIKKGIKQLNTEEINQAKVLINSAEEIQKLKAQEKAEAKLKELTLAQEIKFDNIMISNAGRLAQLRGLSAVEILRTKYAMQAVADVEKDEFQLLKERLNIEYAILKAKKGQGLVTSETVKLYKIANKYGKESVEAINKLLTGEIDFSEFESRFGQFMGIFRKEFGSLFDKFKSFEFFSRGGEGEFIKRPEVTRPRLTPAEETARAKLLLQTQQDEMRRSFGLKPKYLLDTKPKPVPAKGVEAQINVNVPKLEMEVHVDLSKEDLDKKVEEVIINGLRDPKNSISKAVNEKIEKF